MGRYQYTVYEWINAIKYSIIYIHTYIPYVRIGCGMPHANKTHAYLHWGMQYRMRLANASMRFGYAGAYGSEKNGFFQKEFAIQLIKRNAI